MARLRAPTRPGTRLGQFHAFYDATQYPTHGGVRADAYPDLDTYLASGESPSHDDLIGEGYTDVMYAFWAGGNPAGVKVGESNADWASGHGDVDGVPLNEVDHTAIAGPSWVAQWIPAIDTEARKGRCTSLLLYGGGVAVTSATDPATLDSYSVTAEALEAMSGYDITNAIDYNANFPHRFHVERAAARGHRILQEPWGFSDVPSVRPWYYKTYGSITGAKGAPGDTNSWADDAWANNTAVSNGKTFLLPRSLRGFGNRSFISIQATGSAADRTNALLLWAKRAPDLEVIYVDWGNTTADERESARRQFEHIVSQRYSDTRRLQVRVNPGDAAGIQRVLLSIGSMVEPTPMPAITTDGDGPPAGAAILGLPVYDMVIAVAPATIATPLGTTVPCPNSVEVRFYNPADVDAADLNVGFRTPNPRAKDRVDVSLEKNDGSGDTRPWTECLDKVRTFQRLRPLCPLFVDLGTIRGEMVVNPALAADLAAAIADLESPDAVAFFTHCITTGVTLAPQCYPIDGYDMQLFCKTLVTTYKQHTPTIAAAAGSTRRLKVVPVVCRRSIAPFNASPGVFWTAAQWFRIESGLKAAGADARILFDVLDNDPDVDAYIALLADTFTTQQDQRRLQVRINPGDQNGAQRVLLSIGSMVEPTATVSTSHDTEGDTMPDTTRFSIQVQDMLGQNWGGRWIVRFFVTDAPGGDPSATGNTIAVPTGTILQTILAGATYEALTDLTGLVEVDVTVSGAASRFVYADVVGKPEPSLEAAYA